MSGREVPRVPADYSGMRASGRSERHLAHVLDLARDGARIIFVSADSRDCSHAVVLAMHLAQRRARSGFGPRLQFGRGEIAFMKLADDPLRHALNRGFDAVAFDHGCADLARDSLHHARYLERWRAVAAARL